MRVLSVDPGAKHCGFILQEEFDSHWHTWHGTFEPARFLQWMGKQKFDVLIVERPAMGPGADFKTRAVYQDIRDLAERKDNPPGLIYTISPGEWKPFMKARENIRNIHSIDQHAKDAEQMLIYWRLTCLGEK